MKIVDNIARMSTLSRMYKKEGKSIGFVPTMGYLHDGHMSLVKAAKKHMDVAVISIFVNPIQFGPHEDFDKYPRDMKRDEDLARDAGVDVLFYPSVKDMYPDGFSTFVTVERLSEALCGASRPGHFKGVATVVTKLFNIVKPDVAYFGQKDAQQLVIIQQMAKDLNMEIDVKMMPTIREKDGLAMSSRNAYLSESERRSASVLFEALKHAESMIGNGERSARVVAKAIEDQIKERSGLKIDYISIVDPKRLEEKKMLSGEVLIALAAFVGKTRLIDNIIISVDAEKALGLKKG